MTKQAAELRYAVRLRVVFKYFGQLCLVLAALTVVTLLMSLFFGERDISLRYAMVVTVLIALGLVLSRLPAPSSVQPNEGLVLVALMFLFTPLMMVYPMMAAGMGFVDAFFEAISGVTTTGLSTMATLAGAPATFLFSRAWMQWYGGLGIVILSLGLAMQPGLVAKGLVVTEAEAHDLVGGTRAHARRVMKVYVALTVIGILGALLLGVDLFDAVLYTFSAVSTGGFAPYDSSLSVFGWPAQLWVSLLCLAGAVSLAFYHRVYRQRHLMPGDFSQVRALLIAGLVISLLLGISMRSGSDMPWATILHHAPVLAVSAQTTAGFASMPCSQLNADSKLILIFSMLVGGGVGSTAGGFKLLRLLIAVSVFRFILLRTCLPPHAVVEPRLEGRILEGNEIQEALLLILLFVVVVSLSWLAFVAMGFDPLDSLFEVASATGTVGLSVGITNSALPALLKGVLCVDMLMGRLEIIAWLVLLYPGTWFGRRMEVK
ncbi:MAG: TrkH family potassium uptake protein [Proteobacteria bacterium]|nr:TrkH family potassium uptake protein [Pseudomonadota bacterium]MBU4295064.1 TrkH family potassium uptake protein [Pseudomonadota bacterium]